MLGGAYTFCGHTQSGKTRMYDINDIIADVYTDLLGAGTGDAVSTRSLTCTCDRHRRRDSITGSSKMKKYTWITPLAIAAIAFLAQPAGATIMFDIGVGNTSISGYAGPYATVSVTRTDATHATIVFDSNVVAGNIYLFGDGGSVAVNLNASSWSIGSFVATNAGTGFTPGALSDGGGGNEDGFGNFNQTVNSFDGYTHSSDHISFVVTNTGGTWSGDTDVLADNGDGHTAAAHIFVTTSPANASNGALATGYASDGTAPPIPEPGSLLLLGMGLASTGGFGLVRRRRQK